MRNGSLLLCRERHTLFINRQGNHGGTIAFCHRQNLGGALLAIFEIDGVYDRLSRNPFQRLFDYVSFGGVHQDRRRHARGNFFQN